MKEAGITPPLHIYRASAGSGKTFLLASEYLCLLFEHPLKFREILAVTFTNKATEEMKHRIISELRKLAEGKDTPYARIITERHPQLKGTGLAVQADAIYRSILHDYTRFSVSTIDRFVQQVIRAFSYEIGLDSGYELQMNQEVVKEDLAERLFDMLETNEELFNWIRRIAVDRIENGKPWDFRGEMLDFAGEIFQEKFSRFEANMRSLEDPQATFEALRASMLSVARSLELPMISLAEKAISILAESGLSPDDFSYGKSGFINYFNKIKKDKEFEPGSRVLEALGNPDKWLKKSASPATKDNILSLYPLLNPLLEEAVELYREQNTDYQTAKAILQKVDNLNLLRVLADLLADYRRENNALLITDSQQLLRELVKDNDAPFIYEKTGTRYRHFLLDEFQDTSTFQWDNFRPLVEQSVASGNFNLVVGDVKQSIYRWRNGDWRLLQEQVRQDIGRLNVLEKSLQDNYRSRAGIIDFNNHLFSTAPEILQRQFNEEMAGISDEVTRQQLETSGYYSIISRAYADAEQQKPPACLEGGVIDIRFFPKEEARSPNSWRPAAERWICELMDSLIADKGFSPSQLTLLTRNNSDARNLIDLLLQHQQSSEARCRYALISADALVLNASPVIQLLLSALRFLVNEKDSLSLVELVQANALRLGLDLSNHDWYRPEMNHAFNQLPESFRKEHKTLLQSGLYECTEKLISIFSLDEWIQEQAYILTFRDIINQFSAKGKPDIREFLEWWNDECSEKALPLSSALDAVQVMTIHKSKGLAFDVVILPYADWKMQNDNGTLWCDWYDDNSDIEVLPVSISSKLVQTHFAFQYFEEQLMARMDALNMLYVALTRSREAIYIAAPLPAESSNGSSKLVSDLLYKTLSIQAAFENERYFVDGKTDPAGNSEPAAGALQIRPYSANTKLLQNLREPAREDMLLNASGTDQLKIGQLAHLALSRSTNREEIEKVLDRMQLEGVLTSVLREQVRESVIQALGHPQLSEWFGGAYTMINERSILVRGGEVRRPDKVLVSQAETILLDFKFTHEPSESHARQIGEYEDLLKQMGYPSVKSYVYYGFNQSLVPLTMLAVKQGQLFV
ncbi:UvrD-helicase domain-containing protein [Flavihumibacter solisilvae]|uniref:DNA 3'-5' helicase n=1 Tax=Flavihumibacter solisilvae TaxID=1349421 RepID=A0A0C1L8A8_9BACT|nr:UvrD-helicase domain-containing protein [Flavihumibacter solisilvae]KIC96387.1 hypothetical protein OI18_01140 [Flavihumibacter solisilvae]